MSTWCALIYTKPFFYSLSFCQASPDPLFSDPAFSNERLSFDYLVILIRRTITFVMMKTMKYDHPVLLFLLLLSLMCGCNSHGKHYVIEGTTTVRDLEGTWIYSVPMVNASQQTVDSVRIMDGRFRFTGDADSVMIRILRPKLKLRFLVQELLVVAEPGTIYASIDTISSAHGTPQNDLLQQWKEKKEFYENAFGFIRESMRNHPSPVDSLKLAESNMNFRSHFISFTDSLVQTSPGTAVGQFLREMVQ